jgi:hypothetical protein
MELVADQHVRWVSRGETTHLKRLFLSFVLAAACAVSACDQPESYDQQPAVVAEDVVEAQAAEEVATPVVDPAALPSAPPVDTLPPEKRSSEESVQPESETLFY